MEKQCTNCNKVKDISLFYKRLDRHGEHKYYSSWCNECSALYSSENYYKNKKNKRLKERENYAKNKTPIQKAKKKWIENNPEKFLSIKLKNRYGITIEEYYEIYEKQGGVCSICKNKETSIDKKTMKTKRLSVDHDHKTGVVRGLLCINCNHALGRFKDDITIMESAISYIKNGGSIK